MQPTAQRRLENLGYGQVPTGSDIITGDFGERTSGQEIARNSIIAFGNVIFQGHALDAVQPWIYERKWWQSL